MNNINLDINTYSIKELENLFKLPEKYSSIEILEKKQILTDNIIKSNINQNKKEELLIFLDNINNRLQNLIIEENAKNQEDKKINDIKRYDRNHFLIETKNNSFSSILENNKKINKSIIKRTYTVDSLFRQNYTNEDNKSHDYIIELPEIITKAITMSISSIELPLTYYNISTDLNNNIFRIEIYDISSGNLIDDGKIDIILTDGLYEIRYASADQFSLAVSSTTTTFTTQIKAADIIQEINTQIANISSPNTDYTEIIDIYNDISSNLRLKHDIRSGLSFFEYKNFDSNSVIGNHKIKINFDVNNSSSKNCVENNIYQKLGAQLGFRVKNLELNSDNSIGTDNSNIQILSTNICYINYPRYLYIAIDDFQTSSRNYFSIAANSIVAPNIVGRINILSLLEEKTAFKSAAAPGDFLYTQKHIREYFGPTDINKLHIQILDEYGRPFSMNNVDWSFILSFECYYN